VHAIVAMVSFSCSCWWNGVRGMVQRCGVTIHVHVTRRREVGDLQSDHLVEFRALVKQLESVGLAALVGVAR
jgi:hypothetical protein